MQVAIAIAMCTESQLCSGWKEVHGYLPMHAHVIALATIDTVRFMEL